MYVGSDYDKKKLIDAYELNMNEQFRKTVCFSYYFSKKVSFHDTITEAPTLLRKNTRRQREITKLYHKKNQNKTSVSRWMIELIFNYHFLQFISN